jgi:two-component system cell cycle response regulator
MTARILIVDDVPANTRLLEAKLEAEYYQVQSAENGEAGLRLAQSWQPDLVLLDVMMPGMNGFECCRLLKQDPRTLHIPVVMVTTLGERTERIEGLEAGADDFLTKPVEFDTLLARVRGLVRLKRLLDEWRARAETARALGLGEAFAGAPPVAGAKVLVVDDDIERVTVVAQALARDELVTSSATSDQEALAHTAETVFDLIVLSLSLSGDDPLRLASRLRAADATHETPLLLIASAGQRASVLRGFDLGANDWLLRPIDLNELRVRARNQIRRKIYQDRLRDDLGQALQLALIDPLTGLHNQRYFNRHLLGLLDVGQPSGLAVMMLDVDHFKMVNDQHGHAVGDHALRLIARTLRDNTRAFDSIARYGGEEFAVVMPGSDLEDAVAAAQRLRSAVEEAVFEPTPGHRAQLTVSIGVACLNGSGGSAEHLMRAADDALYTAKRAGRNRVSVAETI